MTKPKRKDESNLKRLDECEHQSDDNFGDELYPVFRCVDCKKLCYGNIVRNVDGKWINGLDRGEQEMLKDYISIAKVKRAIRKWAEEYDCVDCVPDIMQKIREAKR